MQTNVEVRPAHQSFSDVWQPPASMGGTFDRINRPTAGARFDRDLPIGESPLQLYSMDTPNGLKVAILLEEFQELGLAGARYDPHRIDIAEGDQFASGFVAISPNSKIPALVDRSASTPVALFESGAILLHLAEKFDRFLPHGVARTDCLAWLFWQVGAAPYLGGGFGHFFVYAPERMAYPIDRYAMETKRQLHVLDLHLAEHEFMAGTDYSIADIAIWPWHGVLSQGRMYGAGQFLDVSRYPHLRRWADQIARRPAVQRAERVLRKAGA